MARPLNKNLRAAILGVFDQQPICSIKNVANELDGNFSYESTRNMILKMEKELLLNRMPRRGNNNQIFFIKAGGLNNTRLNNPDGDNVSLRQFIHDLIEMKSSIIDDKALTAIKVWMLDVIGSSIPEAYEDKNRTVPDTASLKAKLARTIGMLSQMHALLKNFENADVWSPVAQERLAREFKSACIEEHAIIVDRSWDS